MIRHLIIIHFRAGAHPDYLALMGQVRQLTLQIEGIQSFKVYPNESHYVPEGIESVGVEILFKNRDALNRFMEDPRHKEANALFEQYLATPGYMVLTHAV
ncbi:MAG: Dabb family protein [Parachlamydiales bacterium]